MKKITIKDDCHLSYLKNDIFLSMGQLLEKGYFICMKNQMLQLKDKNDWRYGNDEEFMNVQT